MLLVMTAVARAQPCVIHALPGRVRVHIACWAGADKSAVEVRLRRMAGVLKAQANPLTGNVLVFFDTAVTDQRNIMAMIRALVPANAGAHARPAVPSPAPYPRERPRLPAPARWPLVLVHYEPPRVPTSWVPWRRLLDLQVLLWIVKGAGILFSLMLVESPLGLIACGMDVLQIVGEAMARWRRRVP
jgi:hypothetical protein